MTESEGYEHDFSVAIKRMTKESLEWLINAFEISFLEGHKWYNLIKQHKGRC
jgi:hypothetical protein